MPEAWDLAFKSISNSQIGVVKTTSKVVLQPMEVKTVAEFVRKDKKYRCCLNRNYGK